MSQTPIARTTKILDQYFIKNLFHITRGNEIKIAPTTNQTSIYRFNNHNNTIYNKITGIFYETQEQFINQLLQDHKHALQQIPDINAQIELFHQHKIPIKYGIIIDPGASHIVNGIHYHCKLNENTTLITPEYIKICNRFPSTIINNSRPDYIKAIKKAINL